MTHFFATSEQREALYGVPHQCSVLKQVDLIDAVCRRFVAGSPLMRFATSGVDAMDCSPRRDQPGFVVVLDDHTLLAGFVAIFPAYVMAGRRRHWPLAESIGWRIFTLASIVFIAGESWLDIICPLTTLEMVLRQ